MTVKCQVVFLLLFSFKLSHYPRPGVSEGSEEQVSKGEMLVPESVFQMY